MMKFKGDSSCLATSRDGTALGLGRKTDSFESVLDEGSALLPFTVTFCQEGKWTVDITEGHCKVERDCRDFLPGTAAWFLDSGDVCRGIVQRQEGGQFYLDCKGKVYARPYHGLYRDQWEALHEQMRDGIPEKYRYVASKDALIRLLYSLAEPCYRPSLDGLMRDVAGIDPKSVPGCI